MNYRLVYAGIVAAFCLSCTREAEVLGTRYRGMTNIGLRPMAGGTYRTVETHLRDFDEDIYGLTLRISFLRRIRDEIRFPSLEALKEQLALDREACR